MNLKSCFDKSSIKKVNHNKSKIPLNSEFYFKIGSYFLLAGVCILLIPITSNTELMFSDANSARYMISTLIQSEAAIFGVVITLSLVVVQLSASSFSPRVTEIFMNFKKNPDFYVLILIYLGVMVYSTLILKIITDDLNYGQNFDIQTCIWSTFFLAFFAFLALIIYIKRTMNLLKPQNIINILSEHITSENLEEYLVKAIGYKILLEPSRFKIITHIKYKIDSLSYLLGITNYDKEDDDPLLPLVDIIRGSLMKYDYETSTKALKTLEDKIVNLIEEDDFDTLKYCRYAPKDVDYSKISVGAANFKEYQHYLIKKIYKNIFNHFERMGQLAIKHLDYHSSREIITIISHLINKILEKESVNDQAKATINEGLLSLQTIGITASENNMNDIVTDVSKEILEIGHLCISQQLGSNAHKSCEILIKLNPNSVHTWLFAGDTAFLLEMYTNAINAFKKANEIEETPQAYSKLKNIYKKLGFKNEEEVALSEELSLLKKEAYKTDISSIIDDLGTS